MSVDWSEFRDGDRVRVTFEGTWYAPDEHRRDRTTTGHLEIGNGEGLVSTHGALPYATSAELIERKFTPPAAGKLFRNESLWVSLGDAGFRLVRRWDGEVPGHGTEYLRPWSAMAPEWLADIEVIDGV